MQSFRNSDIRNIWNRNSNYSAPPEHVRFCEWTGGADLLYAYTIKPPAMLVVPLTALALDKKTSNDIISVGPKPHYI